jgi:CheY-like chemotaxis protein
MARQREEALKLLEQTRAVALLLTDVVMPGMSGRQLADEARTNQPGLKVLYTTGYTQNAIVHNGVLDRDSL